MECKFCKSRNNHEDVVKFYNQKIPKNEYFWYIWSIIHKDWEFEESMNHKIRVR